MTKVWASYNTRVEECLDKSLKALGVDYVDMYLIVSPGAIFNPPSCDCTDDESLALACFAQP